MNNEYFHGSFTFYQNANADAESVKEGFLVRQYEYSVIMEDLLRHPGTGSVQHYLLLGKRGSGKSTLLRRIQVEIDTDKQLMSGYIAINLAEEQANIYRLFDLLEEIVRELESREIEVEEVNADLDGHHYTRQLFYVIHKALEKADKKLVLLLDNVDRIFESLGDDVSLLRENLENYSDLKIIGGSTRVTEHFWAYDKPFYEFFRVMELKPLTREEIVSLLLYWGEKLQINDLKEFVENRPGQLETIRILTDGLPRTLQFFVNILLTNGQETGYDYLRLLMDKVTPLYQERLNYLPPSQRKIVLQLAFFWEAVGAKELAQVTRMETRLISAQLSQLIEKGVVVKVETKTKNHLYRLSERFFNLWLIFTQGSQIEKRKARYLSKFLENFYDRNEIVEMADKHLDTVKEKKISANKAVLLTKAYSQSKYISWVTRSLLIRDTKNLPGMDEELERGLPLTIQDIIVQISKIIAKKEWSRAIEMVQSIEQEDGIKEWLLGKIHEEKNDLVMAENYFLKSIKKGGDISYEDLAILYDDQGKFEKAEQYYRLDFEAENPYSEFNLSFFYYTHNKSKSEVISILKSLSFEELDEDDLPKMQVIKVWIGDLKNLEQDVRKLADENKYDVSFMLTELLVHHQVNLVHRLFTSGESASQLVEKYLPIYYAMQLLMSDAQQAAIKIPPEIKETVNELLVNIHESRDFYYNQN
jgi:SpoVK/Ycf46/Vps4 family AAA+-type ATPase